MDKSTFGKVLTQIIVVHIEHNLLCTCMSSSHEIYWNKEKHLRKKRVTRTGLVSIGTATWLLCHCFRTPTWLPTGGLHKQCVYLCSKDKEMYGRILKSLNIVNLYRGMSKLKLKINVKAPRLYFRFCGSVAIRYNVEQMSTQNPPNHSNSAFRATETTIHSNRGTFAFVLSFNLDFPRYKFTILRLFNILPYIYISNINRHCLCGPPVGCRGIMCIHFACTIPTSFPGSLILPPPWEHG